MGLLLALTLSAGTGAAWKELQPGVHYATFTLVLAPRFGDGRLHVVRIDPTKAKVQAFASSVDGTPSVTAAEWAQRKKLGITINAGMFELDQLTHTGLMRIGKHQNSTTWKRTYQSGFLVERSKARVADLDQIPRTELDRADVVIQNLRLIKSPGVSVWPENHREWSEAAIAMTSDGQILFVFSRSPLSMHVFNERLLKMGLGVVSAMHVEGGPEASLSIHTGGIDLDLCGSFETGFMPDDSNHQQWPLPNVLGVVAEPSNSY